MRNLGPASWKMLESAGIKSPHDLRERGAIAAFVAVKKAGHQPSLNLLWAIEGALSDRPWQEIARLERLPLLLRLEDFERDAGFTA